MKRREFITLTMVSSMPRTSNLQDKKRGQR